MPYKKPNDGCVRIYALCDPETQEVRYVGKTVADVRKRFSEHIRKAKKRPSTYRDSWIKSLLAVGKEPIYKTLEICQADLWSEREMHWIAHYEPSGLLTNHNEGGRGPTRGTKGMDSPVTVFTTEEVRQAVVLYVLGCSYKQIISLVPFEKLSYRALRGWAEKYNRSEETEGIPFKSEYKREGRL